MSRIVVSGKLAATPRMGGATWVVLQYLLGLQRLGHEVCFVEPIASSALRPEGTSLADSDNAAYFEDVTQHFGFERFSALVLENSRETVGLDYKHLRTLTRGADLLVNLSGLLADDDLIGPIPIRAFVDLEPAFTQVRHLAGGIDLGIDRHTHWVTVGSAVGEPGCGVPTCDLPWISTFQPLVLDRWPVNRQLTRHALTTVATWDGGATVEHAGTVYGHKAHSLRECINLPARTDEQFLLALSLEGNCSNDLASLSRNGWQLVDAERVTGTPDAYRRFIQRSWAELGVARSGYVVSRGGWFSDRSACYLASGRPVIAQDTGFGRFLPTGKGLFAFRDCDDVLAAIRLLRHDYAYHARAARAIAVEYFDSDKVLGRLLAKLGVAG